MGGKCRRAMRRLARAGELFPLLALIVIARGEKSFFQGAADGGQDGAMRANPWRAAGVSRPVAPRRSTRSRKDMASPSDPRSWANTQRGGRGKAQRRPGGLACANKFHRENTNGDSTQRTGPGVGIFVFVLSSFRVFVILYSSLSDPRRSAFIGGLS
jgi:hypothetical protein